MTRATSAARAVLATGSCNLISTDPIMTGGWCLNWMGCPHLRHLSMLSNHVGPQFPAVFWEVPVRIAPNRERFSQTDGEDGGKDAEEREAEESEEPSDVVPPRC
ncbi:unnamed protein product [Boreogadus saida]